MTDHKMKHLTLDARPDRIDFRDLVYRPPLISLPQSFPSDYEIENFFPIYLKRRRILDQGTEGACTGFGLAAVIDYIYWDRWVRQNRTDQPSGLTAPDGDENAVTVTDAHEAYPDSVSPYMLYDLARVYDEWEGEAYSGSSCRGALKGWHKHGACAQHLWRDAPNSKARPAPAWREDAAQRPLGSYYRVNARSINDLQAAIFEVRAVYCSARVHDGWLFKNKAKLIDVADRQVPLIPLHDEITGGHAFAMVGYNEYGFIVQNSWGEDWGHRGFAILSYEDWAKNGNDAWVAALGAPMAVSADSVPATKTELPLSISVSRSRAAPIRSGRGAAAVSPWSSEQAYLHSVVMGNDGNVLRRRIDTASADDNLDLVALEEPLAAVRNGAKHIVIYAHGGLNSESAGIERVMRMGPWLEANGIYPIFLVWRTSLLNALGNIGADFVDRFRAERDALRTEALGDILSPAIDKLQNGFDKAFELAAQTTIGKPVWTQIKQNAEAASKTTGGMRKLVMRLRKLRRTLADEGNSVELHLMGHSAGAILLGHMLGDLSAENSASSTTLFAPACSMDFAARHYGRALDRGVIGNGGLHIHNLSDRNERDDTVGPYGKSLLYLVSRALEDPRKLPLLGLAKCSDAGNAKLAALAAKDIDGMKELLGIDFEESTIKHVSAWRQVAAAHNVATTIHSAEEFPVRRGSAGKLAIKASHGGLDNHLDIVNGVVSQILGATSVPRKITDLSGF